MTTYFVHAGSGARSSVQSAGLDAHGNDAVAGETDDDDTINDISFGGSYSSRRLSMSSFEPSSVDQRRQSNGSSQPGVSDLTDNSLRDSKVYHDYDRRPNQDPLLAAPILEESLSNLRYFGKSIADKLGITNEIEV